MLLNEIFGDDWPDYATAQHIELSKLKDGADVDLLVDIVKDRDWIITYHGNMVAAMISELIVPKVAAEIENPILDVSIIFQKLWYCPLRDQLFGSAKVFRAAGGDYRYRKFSVDKNLRCEILPNAAISGPTHPDDIDLAYVFMKLIKHLEYVYPLEQLKKNNAKA